MTLEAEGALVDVLPEVETVGGVTELDFWCAEMEGSLVDELLELFETVGGVTEVAVLCFSVDWKDSFTKFKEIHENYQVTKQTYIFYCAQLNLKIEGLSF